MSVRGEQSRRRGRWPVPPGGLVPRAPPCYDEHRLSGREAWTRIAGKLDFSPRHVEVARCAADLHHFAAARRRAAVPHTASANKRALTVCLFDTRVPCDGEFADFRQENPSRRQFKTLTHLVFLTIMRLF